MSDFLGSRISLISKSDIRYVGTLHEINSDESTVSLENVRSFGTEGRRGRPDEELAPSDQVYEYIVFRGSDVKDLRIEEHPGIKENKPPAMPDDPAVMSARPRGGAQPPAQAPTGPAGYPQNPYPPNNFYGGPPPPGQWGRGGPGPVPGPGFGNMPYPPPPGWFPPGQGFPPGQFPPGGPGAPGPWGNQPFPPGPGGPPGGPGPDDGNNQRGPPQPSGEQDGKPAPIGAAGDKPKPANPATQGAPPTEPKSLAQSARQPAPAPPIESKPSVEEVVAAAQPTGSNGLASAKPAPRNNRVTPVIPLSGMGGSKGFNPSFIDDKSTQVKATVTAQQTSVEDATNAARAAVAVAMAQLGNTGGNAMDNLTKKVNEMRVNAGNTRGGPVSAGRGRGRGGRTPAAKVEVPDSDFDFAQSNAKFNKESVGHETVSGSPLPEAPGHPVDEPAESGSAPVAYNKASSFFDNISSEARERAENNGQKPGGREWRGEEQRKNMETFGQGSVDGGYRNYRGRGRGRGGAGGRGRGYGRGGRGGNRQNYQSPAEL